MKKYIMFIAIIAFVFPFTVLANEIGDFNKSINVSINCDQCTDINTKEIHLKLYADGKEVQGKDLILKKQNNFKGTFTDLPIFKEDDVTEINYVVKFLEDGEYRSFSNADITLNKVRASKWVSVSPNNIQPGHKYVLFTDNWNYAENGHGKFAVLGYNMSLIESDATADYKIINGKKSLYSLTIDPYPEDIWTVSKVPNTDLLYDGFENYLVFTNTENKRLSLTGFDKGDWIDYVFRQTSKSDGYNESENSWSTTKVELTPIAEEKERFYLSSHNIINDNVRGTRYIGVDHFYVIKPQQEVDYAAHFIAFEYVENQEIEEVYNVKINREICNELQDVRKIKLTNNVNIINIFQDVGDISNIEFRITDPEIIKIENGKIVPLKIGETDVTFRYGYTDYSLHVIVYDLDNPKTNINTYIIIILLSLLTATMIVYEILRSKRLKLQNKAS